MSFGPNVYGPISDGVEERRNYTRVVGAAFLCAAALLVRAGHPTSTVSIQKGAHEDRTPHPCVLHEGGPSSVKVIQTSMSDPSNHWGTVSCILGDASTSTSTSTSTTPGADIRVTLETNQDEDRTETPTTILGFGGAFTEAAALNFKSLESEGQEAVLELLFGEDGLGYSMGRVHMNSCDFSPKAYTFDDVPDDFTLSHFDTDVTHDVQSGMINLLSRASTKISSNNGNLKLMVSPWSPPAWMKPPLPSDPPNSTYASTMNGSVQPSCLREGTAANSTYAATWAEYFSKFLTAYADQGVEVWAVTVQNEPEFPAPWEACSYDITSQREFLEYHLGPVLRRDHPQIQILIYDHNKDHAPLWASTILNSNASQFVDGTAVHWYANSWDRHLDGQLGMADMHALREINGVGSNKKIVIGSEACHCPSTGYAEGDLDLMWYRAEKYAHVLLADLAAGSSGWIEWNLLLDAMGGPNHLNNLCDAPLLAVPHRAASTKYTPPIESWEHSKHGPVHGDAKPREDIERDWGSPTQYLDLGIIVQPMYYYMGHVSKYVREGSTSIPAVVQSASGDDSSRTFRNEEDVSAGGGGNYLVRDGTEVTGWPCEGSTRQSWTLLPIASTSGKRLVKLQASGTEVDGGEMISCLGGVPDSSLGGLTLRWCGWVGAVGVYEVAPVEDSVDEEKGYETVRFMLNETDINSCLIVKPLRNGGGSNGMRGGVQTTIGSCDSKKAIWKLDTQLGEISSSYFAENGTNGNDGDVCLTTGWNFLQVGAFDISATTPLDKHNGKPYSKSVVILNEASDAANYVLKDDVSGRVLMSSSIPPRSIQTVLL